MGLWKYDNQTWIEAFTELWETGKEFGFGRLIFTASWVVPVSLLGSLSYWIGEKFENLGNVLSKLAGG